MDRRVEPGGDEEGAVLVLQARLRARIVHILIAMPGLDPGIHADMPR